MSVTIQMSDQEIVALKYLTRRQSDADAIAETTAALMARRATSSRRNNRQRVTIAY